MQTGKLRLNNKAYTLIEVLLTVVILAASLSVLMPSFFKSADILNHLSGRMGASLLFNDLVQEAEEYLRQSKDLTGFKSESEREVAGRRYHYHLNFNSQDTNKHVYEMTAILEWQDFKPSRFERTIYVFKN